MKIKLLMLLAAVLTLGGCRKAPVEEVKLVILKNEDNLDAQVSFVRGKETLFSLKPKHLVGFMKFMERSACGSGFRTTFEWAESGMDLKPFLLDMKGDGDKRYFILAEWFGGNNAFGYRGYLFDTKDNFSFIGEIPAGECMDYPLKNKDLIFTFADSIAYFGVKGDADIMVDLKLVKGGKAELVRTPIDKFDYESYRKLLKEQYHEPYDMALCCLFGDLASRGELSLAAHYSRLLGVPAKDAGKIYNDCIAAMRRSRLHEYLEQLNGMKI